MTIIEIDRLSDEVLMKRYSKGNAAAFERLYQRHKGPLFRFVLRQVSDQATAEELFQDIWSKIIAQRNEYHVTAKFTTWLYTIARNRIIDHYRVNGKSIQNTSLNDETDIDDLQLETLMCDQRPELILESQKAAEKLKALVSKLPQQQREAFLLKYDGGFNHRDIAEITGQKEETIKSQVRYALKKLKLGLFGGNHE